MTESSPPPAPVSERRRLLWPLLAILTAATFWTVTAEMLPSGLLPAMSKDLGVSEGAIGVLVSAWAVTIAIVGIPLVRLTMRVPRPLLLTISLAATAPANLLSALAPDYTIALTGRILAATAHGLFWALVVSFVASIIDAQRLGRALSLVLAGPTLAGLAGLPLAAFIAEHTSWRTVTSGLSLILALTAAGLWLILPRRVQSGGSQEAEAPGMWDHSAGRVVYVAIGGGLVLVGHFAAFTYITRLVTGLGGLTSGTIPVVLLVLGVTGGVGVTLSGITADRFPRAALIVTAALVALGLGLLVFSDTQPLVFLTGTFVWGLAIGAFPPILQARVLRLASPSFRPLAGSVIVTVLNLGVAAGATLGGIALSYGNHILVFSALIAATVGTLALTFPRGADAPASA